MCNSIAKLAIYEHFSHNAHIHKCTQTWMWARAYKENEIYTYLQRHKVINTHAHDTHKASNRHTQTHTCFISLILLWYTFHSVLLSFSGGYIGHNNDPPEEWHKNEGMSELAPRKKKKKKMKWHMEFIMFIGTQLLHTGPSPCSHSSFAKKSTLYACQRKKKKALSLKRWLRTKSCACPVATACLMHLLWWMLDQKWVTASES